MEQKTEEPKQGAGAREAAKWEETGTPEGPRLLPDERGPTAALMRRSPGPDDHGL